MRLYVESSGLSTGCSETTEAVVVVEQIKQSLDPTAENSQCPLADCPAQSKCQHENSKIKLSFYTIKFRDRVLHSIN